MPRALSAAVQVRVNRCERVWGQRGCSGTGAQVTGSPGDGSGAVTGSARRGPRIREWDKLPRFSPAVPGGPTGGERGGSSRVVPQPGQGTSPLPLLGLSARLRSPLPPSLWSEIWGV